MNNQTHILIVEDSPTQREELSHILQSNGFSVTAASNGREALERIDAASPPDIIVSDIVMPEMDGYALCREIKARQRTSSIPVVILTSLSDPEDVVRGLESGADSFITKPYSEKFLLTRIEYVLANRSLPREDVPGEGIELLFAGRRLVIHAARRQILDLLISAFESAVEQRKEVESVNDELLTAQRDLVRKNRELSELNQQKNHLLGMAAHDLRSPLGIILGCARFLLEENASLPQDQTMLLDMIKSSSDFMLNLVSDILDISQIESGALKLDMRLCDLGETVRRSVKLNNILAEKKRIAINLSIDGELPPFRFDERKIAQVLNNLISNAVKYSQPESEVDIRVARRSGHVLVTVRDQGLGIKAAEMDWLFKPFSRTSSKTTGEEQSTGLGLAISKRLVHGHGGEIWAESEEGKGATFSFTLHLDPDDE